MDRQLDMVVNRLPQPTWNRLNMNETKLAGMAIPTEAVYQIQTAENTTVRKFNSGDGIDSSSSKNGQHLASADDVNDNLWDSIETGMGEDIATLGQEIVPNLFTVSMNNGIVVTDDTTKTGVAYDKETKPTCEKVPDNHITLITIEETDANTFCNFLIHAKPGTNSHFAFICKSAITNENTCNKNEECQNSGNSNPESGNPNVSGGTLTVQVKVIAEPNATVRISCVQALGHEATGIFDIGGICEENARIELTRLELGAAKQYTGCCISLNGTSSSFAADIGYKESGSQHLDMNYIARHRGRHTTSRMDVTGVLRDHAFKIFRGSIDFIAGCAGAKGDEQEEVLLLGDDVANQTVPLILCAEEDVEGNHGATIGEIDERTLFYLASRGIARDEAEQLISRARIEAVSSLLPLAMMQELVNNYL